MNSNSYMYRLAIIFLLIQLNTGRTYAQAKGYALLVGIDQVDQNQYRSQGIIANYNYLPGIRNDLDNIKSVLLQSQFEERNITVLKNNVTAENILDTLRYIKYNFLKPGDLFVFYYSGHGDSLPDKEPFDEKDKMDEVIVTYNHYLLDDSLFQIWNTFDSTIRILMIADACHSGSLMAFADFTVNKYVSVKKQKFKNEINAISNAMIILGSQDVAAVENETITIPASFQMIYFSATDDFSSTPAPSGGSLFTNTIRSIYSSWAESGLIQSASYLDFYNQIHEINDHFLYSEYGKVSSNFKHQQLFKIK